MSWLTNWIKQWLKQSNLEKMLVYKKQSEDDKKRILEIDKIISELKQEKIDLESRIIENDTRAKEELDNLFISQDTIESDMVISETFSIDNEVLENKKNEEKFTIKPLSEKLKEMNNSKKEVENIEIQETHKQEEKVTIWKESSIESFDDNSDNIVMESNTCKDEKLIIPQLKDTADSDIQEQWNISEKVRKRQRWEAKKEQTVEEFLEICDKSPEEKREALMSFIDE